MPLAMTRRWVCLMYHDVTTEHPPAAGAGAFFAVSAQSFARQLSLIRDAGVDGCSIAAAMSAADAARVAISFDDGNLGQAARAFPALVASGMTATFFVTTGWVGRPGFATWEQLREMSAAGMAIESHTHSHPFLSEVNEANLRDELRRSRDLLCEKVGGQQPTMIALPGGDAPRAPLRQVFADEGYRVVATSRWGRNRDEGGALLHYVRRCTVRGDLGDREFLDVVNGDRWLGARKRARESTLAAVRRVLGPTRYARWRRSVLDAVAGSPGAC